MKNLIIKFIKEETPTRITDIGSGTGSTIRAIEKETDHPIAWHLVDNDAALLDVATAESQNVDVKTSLADLSKSLDAVFAHDGFEIVPRGVAPIGSAVSAFVDDLVQNLKALVGQPDLVGVGIGEHPAHKSGIGSLRLGTVFAADVAGWLLNVRQPRLEERPDGCHWIAI